MSKSSGQSFHNRYPYSCKIICEEHGTTYHRQVLKKKAGDEEVWQCKIYRTYGSKACSSPQIRSCELDEILSQIFTELAKDKQAIIDSLVTVLVNVPKDVDYAKLRSKVQSDIDAIRARKDRILDLQIAGAITIDEFKVRNDTCNEQLLNLEAQLAAIEQEELQAAESDLDIDEIRKALEQELDFSQGINSALVATILDKVIVKKESTKEDIHLEIYLKLGQKYEAVYNPKNSPASINCATRDKARRRFLRRAAGKAMAYSGDVTVSTASIPTEQEWRQIFCHIFCKNSCKSKTNNI